MKRILLAACVALGACTAPDPVVDADAPTYDGLVPVRESGLREAWVRPAIDLSRYEQMVLLPI